MATSGNLAAGQAARSGTGGPRHRARVVGLVATGTLVLGLLIGLVFNQYHRAPSPANHQDQYPYVVDGGAYSGGTGADVNTMSDLGTEYDPFFIQGAQPMYKPSTSPPALPCWIEEVAPGETLYQSGQTSIASQCQA